MGAAHLSNHTMALKAKRLQHALATLTREALVQLSLKLYKQLVEPISLYATEIWAPYALTRTHTPADSIINEIKYEHSSK